MTEAQVLAGLAPDDIPMLMDGDIVSTNDEVLQRLADLPLQAGDCMVDVLQGLYWMAKNRELLAWQAPAEVCEDGPIICCGSGPSLDDALPLLRDLQSHYRIVCAHSTLERLLEAGITPDVYTPLERVSPAVWDMPTHPLPPQVVYGGLAVVPDEHERCTHRLCVTSDDATATWFPARHVFTHRGTMAGTLAAGVSLAMTTGPVYLIGHDLSLGHYAGYRYPEQGATRDVLCVDGATRPTDFYMQRAVRELAGMSDGRLVQCAPTGARIAHASADSLPPVVGARKRMRLPKRDQPWRIEQFRATLRRLPGEWRSGMRRLASASTAADISVQALWPEAANTHAFQALLRPTYLALSIERRCGRGDVAVAWFKEILANVDQHIMPVLEEMAHDC